MKNKLKLIAVGLAVGLCNGLFGSGGGTVAVPFMEKYANLEPQKAHATAILVILPLCVVSIFRYRSSVQVDFKTLATVCVSGVLGSAAGALFLKKLSSNALRKIFGVLIIAAAVKAVML